MEADLHGKRVTAMDNNNVFMECHLRHLTINERYYLPTHIRSDKSLLNLKYSLRQYSHKSSAYSLAYKAPKSIPRSESPISRARISHNHK